MTSLDSRLTAAIQAGAAVSAIAWALGTLAVGLPLAAAAVLVVEAGAAAARAHDRSLTGGGR